MGLMTRRGLLLMIGVVAGACRPQTPDTATVVLAVKGMI